MDLYHKYSDTRRCLPYSTSHPKQCLNKNSFLLARQVCMMVENNSVKNKHLNELKRNFKTWLP